ncbi:MAG: beta-ketoacyl synthase N-terminal-like domain-containing protein [Microcoleus sp.]
MSNIAIIGTGALFPQAKNIQEYWENIIGKVDCITDVPTSRWSVGDYYDRDPKAPDKTYSNKGGFIPEIDFNPVEFGLPPNLLEVTDISQLLSLVVAKQTLADAGYAEARAFDRDRTGVILGAALGRQLSMPLIARLEYPVWEKVLKSSGLSDEDTQTIVEKIQLAYINWDENAFPGLIANVIAGRIAKYFNLGGINCVVDAACASSLAAIQMAIDELTLHRCDMILTGGVDLDNSLFVYLCFSKTPALSRKQKSRPFDIDADGMMLGEGIGMVLLKRLEDAERDNDKIYAVIKGIGSASDGRSKSIYAPHSEGQIKAMRRAYEDAGIAPETVGFIEAHGTATLVGDPVEFSAIKTVFGQNNPRTQHIALGSIKSQIGHTKAAAGAASLIKATLALHHKILPPTINITQPNPKLDIENSPFYLNTETRPWIADREGVPRRAGVSSFGFGGTNYHVILEEYNSDDRQANRLHKVPDSVVLFAPNAVELLARCEAVLSQLRSTDKELEYAELVKSSKSLDIPASAARIGFVSHSPTEACKKLQISINQLKTNGEEWEHPQGIYYRSRGIELEGKVVAIFSGQGSQYLEMGRELALNFPQLREAYGYLDRLSIGEELKPVSRIVFPPPVFAPLQNDDRSQTLQQTEYAQPAIGALSVSLYKILQQAGLKVDFVAGHSFGELTALWAAEVLSDEDYFFLVKARGKAMAVPDRPNFDAGTMMAVKGNIDRIQEIIQQFPTIAIANFNSPQQLVLSGAKSGMIQAQKTLTERGFSCFLLPVAAAFHTPSIGYAQKPFAEAVDRVTFKNPKIPVYTNVTGDSYPIQPQAIQKNLKEHLLHPVRFQQEIETIYDRGGYCFIEFGPRNILTNLVKEILSDRPHLAVALNASRTRDSDRQLREAVVQLRVAGLPLKNFDPYQNQIESKAPTPGKHSSLSVPLNGSNYVSEKTKNTFERALQNSHQVKITSNNTAEAIDLAASTERALESSHQVKITSNNTAEVIDRAASTERALQDSHQVKITSNNTAEVIDRAASTAADNNGNARNITQSQPIPMTTPMTPESQSVTMPLDDRRILESLEYAIGQFNQHQSNTLLTHQQYLQCHAEYTKAFCQLTQQQNSLLLNGNLPPEVRESLQHSMMQFHKHHSETLRVHEQYLNQQVDYARNFFQLTQQAYSRLTNDTISPAALPPQNILNNSLNPPAQSDRRRPQEQSSTSLPSNTKILSPAPQPSSLPAIASVQTPASVSEPQPIVPTVDRHNNYTATPSSLTAAESLAQPEPILQKALTVTTIPPDPTPIAIDFEELTQTVLQIVSEKTGYPTEVLELDMDMEADLGIDSLKRVEIMGAIQDRYPNMIKPNLEELADLNLQTLSQVAEYMQGLIPDVKKKSIALNLARST